MPDAKLFRGVVEVEVIYEADGPKHAVEYGNASIVSRIAAAAQGREIEPFAWPDLSVEHISAKARLTKVEILSRNGEVVLEPDGLNPKGAVQPGEAGAQ